MKPYRSAALKAASKHSNGTGRAPTVPDACVVRQPIFAGNGEVAGYELLYRRAATDTAAGKADRAVKSADVIVHTFLALGLDRLTSGRSAFMTFTREMLLSRAYALLPPDSVVVELLESVEPDDAVEQACEELVDAGYNLALHDFVWDPRYRRLLELASIVKVDVMNQPPATIDEIAQRVAPYDVRLLAERVETANVRAMCAGLGYELFQGHYFARPEPLMTRALTSDELAIVRAMNVMRDERATETEVATVLSADLGLSCKLLRMVNSAARGGGAIESIGHAVQLTSRTELSKWLALLLVSSMAARGGTNRELMHLAIQRGRMCELLAGPTGRDRDSGSLFLVGLFSLLDAISGIPMPELLDAVALAPALREALLSRAGPYAVALVLAEAYERGAWGTVAQHARMSGIDTAQVGSFYVQSLAWTRDQFLVLART